MGTVRYTVIDGEVISENRNGALLDYVPDPLGSTVAMLDNTQTITDTFTYWPYGEVVNRSGTTPTQLQYVGTRGYYKDNASTNVKTYVRARYLDHAKCRWLTQDPIGFEGRDVNLYRYIVNNPLTYTDPSGMIMIIFPPNWGKPRCRLKLIGNCKPSGRGGRYIYPAAPAGPWQGWYVVPCGSLPGIPFWITRNCWIRSRQVWRKYPQEHDCDYQETCQPYRKFRYTVTCAVLEAGIEHEYCDQDLAPVGNFCSNRFAPWPVRLPPGNWRYAGVDCPKSIPP